MSETFVRDKTIQASTAALLGVPPSIASANNIDGCAVQDRVRQTDTRPPTAASALSFHAMHAMHEGAMPPTRVEAEHWRAEARGK